ncbi:MAG TPA: glycosyltransferase family 39 protein, partial [Chloroflexota bacterium]|nr:glycosyltransferase family 39 protein [Chloroflexota bacterium]
METARPAEAAEAEPTPTPPAEPGTGGQGEVGERGETDELEAPVRSLRDYLPVVSVSWPASWRRPGGAPPAPRPASPARPARRPRERVPGTELLLLAVILLIGAAFRFTGVDWDSGHHLHPDERFLTMVEGAIRPGLVVPTGRDGPVQIQPAGLLESYFDSARSALNPHNVGYGFFVYGTFPLFAVRALAELLGAAGYDRVHLLGRVLSGLADLVTVYLVYRIGRRLYGPRVGLLAGALLAACVLHIQQAHFFVFDSYLVTLITAAFYFCVDIAETGRWRSFALAGLFFGLALATKLSMVVFAPIVALAGLIYLWRDWQEEGGSGLAPWAGGRLSQIVGGGLLAALVAALVFRVFQPYAFAGPGFFDLRLNPRWLDNIAYQAKSQDGSVDLPPSIQWAGTTPLLFPWRHMIAWGLGLPLGLAAWAGFVAAGMVVLRHGLGKGAWRHVLVLAWAALCFVYFASVLNKTMRYLLPAYPFFILLAAWGLVALYEWAKQRGPHQGRASAASDPGRGATRGDLDLGLRRLPGIWLQRGALALGALVLVASTLWAYAFTRIYTRPVSRVTAAQWIYENVPKGSVLANEHWDDPLPMPLPGYDPSFYRGPQLPLYDPDEPKKLDTLVQMLSQADYINLTSNRLYESIPRMPQRYPMTTEYYRRLFAGDLGFEPVATFASYPTLGPWTINDDRAEEAFTVYDHPKVLIFKKTAAFSPERVRQILSAVPLDDVRQVPPIQAGRTQLM